MKLAILSDIHSNKYALAEVLRFIEYQNVDKYVFLGDYFGYYPWANETFKYLEKLFAKSHFIIGNHDDLILRTVPPKPLPEYWDVIIQNKSELSLEALEWLGSLKPSNSIVLDNVLIDFCHGTPDEPLTGRFYPDNDKSYDWFPKKNEILLMGHTHYPIYKKLLNGGLIVNPGSVGQPRDGILESSLCILDTKITDVKYYRVPFQIEKAITELEKINWYPRAIKSLKKSKSIE